MRPSSRPIIGVTGPDRGGWPAWIFTRYAVWKTGGKAVRITPRRPSEITELDGLILGGGADVDPSLYDEPLFHSLKRSASRPKTLKAWIVGSAIWLLRRLLSQATGAFKDAQRDELEMRLLRGAVDLGLPVLGICRGAQLINVFFGGSLYQDIRSFYAETPQIYTVFARKLVHLADGGHLHRIFGRLTLQVNSLHNQSIRDVGSELIVCAWETSGVVQAVEHVNRPFLIGVQWHPEYLPYRKDQLRLFSALAGSAAETSPMETTLRSRHDLERSL